jgi:predicted nucleic acid-binding protein
MRQFNLGRKRILDTHLAAILHTAGINRLMTSNPGDFAVFGVIQVIPV